MSKSILLILLLYFLISTAYCKGDLQYCESKFSFNYDNPGQEDTTNTNTLIKFEDGSDRDVWHHADSCNSLKVESNPDRSCCYIHIEYKSEVTGKI